MADGYPVGDGVLSGRMTIKSSADGTRIWAEVDEGKMLTAMDLEALKMAARRMGARVTDPTGAAEFTVRFNAHWERHGVENWIGEKGYDTMLSPGTRQSWYREEMDKVARYEREALDEIGK
jgi:DNA-binding response OmpR family regulator